MRLFLVCTLLLLEMAVAFDVTHLCSHLLWKGIFFSEESVLEWCLLQPTLMALSTDKKDLGFNYHDMTSWQGSGHPEVTSNQFYLNVTSCGMYICRPYNASKYPRPFEWDNIPGELFGPCEVDNLDEDTQISVEKRDGKDGGASGVSEEASGNPGSSNVDRAAGEMTDSSGSSGGDRASGETTDSSGSSGDRASGETTDTSGSSGGDRASGETTDSSVSSGDRASGETTDNSGSSGGDRASGKDIKKPKPNGPSVCRWPGGRVTRRSPNFLSVKNVKTKRYTNPSGPCNNVVYWYTIHVSSSASIHWQF